MRYIKSLDDALDIITREERQKSCVITDPNQIDNPIVYVTPEFERQTGYRQDEVIGRNPRFLQGQDTDPDTVEKIRHAVEHMLPVEAEILNYRKNGSPYWNKLSIRPVFSEVGKLKSFVASQYLREIGDVRTKSDDTIRQIAGTVLLRSGGSRHRGLSRLTRPTRRNRSSHP
jgi:PAS domain S-box-containing protein